MENFEKIPKQETDEEGLYFGLDEDLDESEKPAFFKRVKEKAVNLAGKAKQIVSEKLQGEAPKNIAKIATMLAAGTAGASFGDYPGAIIALALAMSDEAQTFVEKGIDTLSEVTGKDREVIIVDLQKTRDTLEKNV